MRSSLAALLVPLLLLLAARATAVDAKPEAPRIAVLRLEEAMTGFKMYTLGMEKLKKDVADGQQQIKAIEDDLQNLDAKLQVMKPESENFAKVQLDFETLKLKEKMMVERGNQDIARRRAGLVKEAYANLRTALQSFCQERGIKLVHLAPNPDIQGADNKEINQQLFAQSVLYFDPSLDITDAFIPYLNEHWSARSTQQHQEQAVKDAPIAPTPVVPPIAPDKVPAGVDAPATAPGPTPVAPGK